MPRRRGRGRKTSHRAAVGACRFLCNGRAGRYVRGPCWQWRGFLDDSRFRLRFRLIMPQVTEAPPEPARVAAVRRTALLDTHPEEAFDRLTRLAAMLLGTSV